MEMTWKSRLHPPGQKSAKRVSDALRCTAEQSRAGADWFIDYQTYNLANCKLLQSDSESRLQEFQCQLLVSDACRV
ncbi:hypothetical protein ACLKA7_010467 [Drosophila subpalustris]